MRNPFIFEPEPLARYLGTPNNLEDGSLEYFERDPFVAYRKVLDGELEPATGSTPPGPQFHRSVAKLAKEWSDRRKGTPSVEAMTGWLRQDHQETLSGARLRWRKRPYPTEAISRAWLISRSEQMLFQTEMPSALGRLRNFAPPSQPVSLVSSLLINDSDTAPVAL